MLCLARDAARLRVKGDRSRPGVDLVQEKRMTRQEAKAVEIKLTLLFVAPFSWFSVERPAKRRLVGTCAHPFACEPHLAGSLADPMQQQTARLR